MIRKLSVAYAVAAALMIGAAGSASAAGTDEDREATALLSLKITLSQAIATAEQRSGGKAFDAGVDIKDGKPHIVVETNGAKGVQTVTIDAQTGRVIGIQAGGQAD
jgi:uncharacterized membrane protein YkoI